MTTNRARKYRRSGLGSVWPSPAPHSRPGGAWPSKVAKKVALVFSLPSAVFRFCVTRFFRVLRKGRWANWHLKVFVPLPFTDSPSPDFACCMTTDRANVACAARGLNPTPRGNLDLQAKDKG